MVEQDQLWVPAKAQAITDKAKYDAVFSNTMRRNTLYFTAKGGGNILKSPILAEIRKGRELKKVVVQKKVAHQDLTSLGGLSVAAILNRRAALANDSETDDDDDDEWDD